MRHRNIVGLLFVASLLALLLSRSGYCQSAGPTVTVLVKDGYSGKPISHFELYVDFEDRTSEMLRADKHGLIKISIPDRNEYFELHDGSYVIRCQTGYTSKYLVREVLQNGTIRR